MIIKTLFLAGCMLASALASGDGPFPAALLVQSNFDFSLTRKEFRVHYGGLRAGSATTPEQVYIKLYGPTNEKALTYTLKANEKQNSQAFHFALDEVKDGKYEVEVCEDDQCSPKTPALHDVFTSRKHMLSCKHKTSNKLIEVEFVAPSESDWAQSTTYTTFSTTVNTARKSNDYQTENQKYNMNGANPFYSKADRIFHAAIVHDLKRYMQLFETDNVDEYCGRKNMLSLHAHIVDTETKKVVHRFKTVNHLSEGGKQLFILGSGGPILLETTHHDVEIEDGTYKLLVSLCVTDKDTIESTYCANPITKEFTVTDGVLTSS